MRDDPVVLPLVGLPPYDPVGRWRSVDRVDLVFVVRPIPAPVDGYEVSILDVDHETLFHKIVDRGTFDAYVAGWRLERIP
jgi:hypothetical protein